MSSLVMHGYRSVDGWISYYSFTSISMSRRFVVLERFFSIRSFCFYSLSTYDLASSAMCTSTVDIAI
jgi:hypothetical protein